MANDQILKRLKWPDPELQTGDEFVRVSDIAALFAPVAVPLPGPVPPTEPEAPTPVPDSPRIITHVKVRSTSDADQENVPITFGQVFAPGDVPAGAGLVGIHQSGDHLPVQMDVKATHPDGSVRHAAIAAVLGGLAARGEVVLGLAVLAGAGRVYETKSIPVYGVDTEVNILLEGKSYRTKLPPAVSQWLSGPVVQESRHTGALVVDDGTEQPHLCARFGIRTYQGGRARVEVVIENNWAYEPEPRNFTYDLSIAVDGQVVAEEKNLEHFHHARGRWVFWVGGEPMVHIEHDAAYLIGTRALPNYDLSEKVHEATLAGYLKKWNDTTVGPMKIGPLAKAGMPAPGGRNDLGLLPGWAAAYLISQDERAKRVTLGTAEMAGSWSVHYRDKNTDLPVSVIDYPYMTLLGKASDTLNPATKLREAFPPMAKATSATPLRPDASHQPAFSYLPYLVTAEHYDLEELQFWCMWNVFQTNPGYRGNVLGLINRTQVRGQAWTLRTLAETAYITPDAHPLKGHFEQILDNNLDWYNTTYSDNPDANKLGVLDLPGAIIYYEDTAVAPWQDDFFTQAVGRVAELGYAKAEPLLHWKAKFPIGRMVGEGFCWLAGAEYGLRVRDRGDVHVPNNPTTGEKAHVIPATPIYETFAEVYAATVGPDVAALPCGDAVAAALDLPPGAVGNYPTQPTGYAANMQPALAYAAGTGEDGRRAWELFMSRDIKPDYGVSPQFAIIPR